MRWFVTGDCHGDITKILDFIKKYNLGENDNIIVCGDMGLFWRKDKKDAEENINKYEQLCNGTNLYWLDGNHENFDIIKEWNCGNEIYKNSNHIYYCPRGSILTLNIDGQNKTALFMGGADSVDRFRRIKHLSWWEDEKIIKEDIEKVDKIKHYDYIFTHAAPQSVVDKYKWQLCILLIAEELIDHSSEQRLEEMFENLDYDKHYFGHYHSDVKLDDKHTCLLNNFIEL